MSLYVDLEKYLGSKLSVINCQIMNDMLLVYSSILEIEIMFLQNVMSFVLFFNREINSVNEEGMSLSICYKFKEG